MKGALSWIFLALPKQAGELAKELNVQWSGIVVIIGALAVGSAATAWYYRQVKPSDLVKINSRLESIAERQRTMVDDVLYLRRAVCRIQGVPAARCEQRSEEHREEYRQESRTVARDATRLEAAADG